MLILQIGLETVCNMYKVKGYNDPQRIQLCETKGASFNLPEQDTTGETK
jgi:hypothetical protein